MRRIRYLGPAHVLITMEGERVLRGAEAVVSEQEADFMAHSPHTWIDVLGRVPRPKRRPEAESGEGQDKPGESPGEQAEE